MEKRFGVRSGRTWLCGLGGAEQSFSLSHSRTEEYEVRVWDLKTLDDQLSASGSLMDISCLRWRVTAERCWVV
jgi:hypothetical protein